MTARLSEAYRDGIHEEYDILVDEKHIGYLICYRNRAGKINIVDFFKRETAIIPPYFKTPSKNKHSWNVEL
jgi:hypothetical protein